MKILAFAASNSRNSINRKLVKAAAELLPDAEIELIDLNDYEMPIFSVDREAADGVHSLARKFFEKIGAADALLISYAEHNGYYTASFKNIFDWASRIDENVYQGKPMVIMATSPGKGGGSHVLESAKISAPFYGADIRGVFSLPKFRESFDTATGRLKDSEKIAELRSALEGLVGLNA